MSVTVTLWLPLAAGVAAHCSTSARSDPGLELEVSGLTPHSKAQAVTPSPPALTVPRRVAVVAVTFVAAAVVPVGVARVV